MAAKGSAEAVDEINMDTIHIQVPSYTMTGLAALEGAHCYRTNDGDIAIVHYDVTAREWYVASLDEVTSLGSQLEEAADVLAEAIESDASAAEAGEPTDLESDALHAKDQVYSAWCAECERVEPVSGPAGDWGVPVELAPLPNF